MDQEIEKALAESPLLKSLSERQRNQLASFATVRTFSQGQELVRQGDTGALALWIVVDGNVAVSRDGTMLAEFGAGAHIGEMAVLVAHDLPRTADVVAKDEVKALRIAKWDLLTFIKSNPEVAMTVISELADRLEAANTALAGGE